RTEDEHSLGSDEQLSRLPGLVLQVRVSGSEPTRDRRRGQELPMNSTVFLHLFRQGFDVSRVELNFIAVLQQEGDRGMFVFEELERFRVRARLFLVPERELTMKFQPTIERLR